jgi:prepilin-type N-terminal cleavage/methylation domain-containing protein
MKKINKKGFTLIELLVVIAIIGLLSTMAVVSLNSARMKSRDARRLSDVKQLSTMMSLASTNSTEQIMCGAAACVEGDATTLVSAPTELAGEFSKFHDPSLTPAQHAVVTNNCGIIANRISNAPCNYAFRGMTNVSSSTIYFFLEAGTSDLTGGQLHSINSDGVFNP